MKNRILSVVFTVAVSMITAVFPVSATEATPDEVYRHNLKIYNSQPADPESLEFYKLPSRDDTIKSGDKAIIDLAESITENISDDYSRIKAVHDWVADNIYYDHDASGSKDYEDTSALGVLELKRSVCEGYAKLTVALLRAAGIPAKYIDGFVLGLNGIKRADVFYDLNSDELNHAWCEAFADGRWIIIDVTWDSRNRYENGEYSQFPRTDKYFDISLEEVSANHKYRDYSFAMRLFDLPGSVIVPDCITVIEDYEFYGCINLESVVLHDGVTSIGTGAFRDCINLKSVNIPGGSVTSIGNSAFMNCASLKSIIIPDSIVFIENVTFKDCVGLTDIIIPGSIIRIGNGAFQGCTSLASIVIPDGVFMIGRLAFKDCVSLTNITIPGSVHYIVNDYRNDYNAQTRELTRKDFTAFDGCDKTQLTIYGTSGSYAEEYAGDNGIKFVSDGTFVPAVTEILTDDEISAITEVSETPGIEKEEESELTESNFIWLLIICLIIVFILTGFVIINKFYNFTKNSKKFH